MNWPSTFFSSSKNAAKWTDPDLEETVKNNMVFNKEFVTFGLASFTQCNYTMNEPDNRSWVSHNARQTDLPDRPDRQTDGYRFVEY